VDAITPLIDEGPGSEDIGAWLSSVRHDPVAFVRGAFPWGTGELKGAVGPESWQLWLLTQIKQGLLTPNQAIRIAISSGHGIGKSACCAWVVLWAVATAPDTRALITASSESMLMTRLRGEIRKWFRLFKGKEFFSMGATSLTSSDPEYEQTWRADLLPWNSSRPEAFAGLHVGSGRRLLLVFDEASAIEPPIWETCEAIATDADAEVIWLVCGNPLHPEGRFKDCFEKYRDTWITRHISSLSVSFTNKAEFERWGRDYGVDSDFYRTRVLGEFPKVGSDQFISPAAVDAAMQRELDPSHHDPLVLGVDVARFGSDSSVLFARKGMDCRSIPPQVFKGLSTVELEDRIVNFCNKYPVQEIFVDGGGVGGGVVDHLRRRGYMVHDIQFGAKAELGLDGIRFANKRAELWGSLRAALPYLCLPHSPTLKQEMCEPQYSFDKQGNIILESKDLMRRRGVASPDQADAIAVTFGAPIGTLPVLASAPRSPEWDYNPFDDRLMHPEEGKPFVDGETGYQFRMRGRWNNDRDFTMQDYQDAAASDAMRFAWEEPQE
jgi:hypothetical protein